MTRPHYLLFSEAAHDSSMPSARQRGTGGRWKFALEAIDGSEQLAAADAEEDLSPERLELLSVVRGLEALPQPSRVTLITTSRYVGRGMRFGLAEWRENGWQWEHFGQMSVVANADLWQRLDAALRIHDVQFRTLRFDAAHCRTGGAPAEPVSVPARTAEVSSPALAERGGAAGRGEHDGCLRGAPTPRAGRPGDAVERGGRASQWLRGWLRRSPVRAAQLI